MLRNCPGPTMKVTAPYGNADLASWLTAAVVLLLVVGLPYLAYLFIESRDIELSGFRGLLFSLPLIVFIIAAGGLAMKVLSPVTSALSDKGDRELSFEGERVIDAHQGFDIDLGEAHVAHLSGSIRMARVVLFGADSDERIPISIRGYSRQDVIELFDDAYFVTPLGPMVDPTKRLEISLREEHPPITDRTEAISSLYDGFNLNASTAGHAEIFEAIVGALAQNKSRNLAFEVHSQFPWNAAPEPQSEYIRRLDLDDPDDAALAESVEDQAYIHVSPWAYVSADYLLFHQVGAADVAADMATLGQRDFDDVGTHYLLPLGHVESHYVLSTKVGTSADNITMQESVYELRGSDRRGNKVHLEIPRGFAGSDRLGDDNRSRLERETLHRFVNEMAARVDE
jgi:hypothetical protein